jgi:hypothetical protein
MQTSSGHSCRIPPSFRTADLRGDAQQGARCADRGLPSLTARVFARDPFWTFEPAYELNILQRQISRMWGIYQGQFPAITLSFNLAPGIALGQAGTLARVWPKVRLRPSRDNRRGRGSHREWAGRRWCSTDTIERVVSKRISDKGRPCDTTQPDYQQHSANSRLLTWSAGSLPSAALDTARKPARVLLQSSPRISRLY